MTIAFDAFTNKDESDPTIYVTPPFLPFSFSHAGGSGLGGVLIFATARYNIVAPPTCDFTYGGLSVPLIETGDGDTGQAAIKMRRRTFLLSCIPDGTQTVQISSQDQVNEQWSISVITFATTGGGIAVDDTATLHATVANPSLSISNSADAAIIAAASSDHDSNTDFAPATGCTDIFEDDHGIDENVVVRRTNIESPGTYSVGWTATSEETDAFALAVIEASCDQPYWGILMGAM